MGSNKSRTKTIGVAILATAAITAAATTMVLSLRDTAPTPVVTQRSVVYVPVTAPGMLPTNTTNAPVGRAALTSAELAGPSASDTAEPPDSEQPSAEDTTESPAQPGYSLSDVLEGARSKLASIGAASLRSTPAPVETPAALAEAAPVETPAQLAEQEPPPATLAQQEPAQPVIGAGAFTTPDPYRASAWQSPANAGAGAFTTPGPYSASAWQSNPTAGAGQFSTDKGSIDPSVGAGPFTTEWHIATSYPQ